MELLPPSPHKLLVCLALVIVSSLQIVNSDLTTPNLFTIHVSGLGSNVLIMPNSSVMANKQAPSLYNLFAVQFHQLGTDNHDLGLKMTLQSVVTQRYVCMNATGNVYSWKARGRRHKTFSHASGCPLPPQNPGKHSKRPLDTNDIVKSTKLRHQRHRAAHLPEDCYFLLQRLPADIANSADAIVSFKHSNYSRMGRYLRFKKNGQAKGVKLRFPLMNKPRKGVDFQLLPDPNITSLIKATAFKSTKRYDYRVRTCLYKKHLNKTIFAPKYLSNDKISQVINKCRCIAYNEQPTLSNAIAKRHI